MKPKKADPFVVAEKIRFKKHPKSIGLFAAGSCFRGEGTAYSDIDIVVLYNKIPDAYRASFICDEWPVETFVHDMESLKVFFKSDIDRGYPSLVHMVATGHIFGDKEKLSAIQKSAISLIKKGPIRVSKKQIEDFRYKLTDLLDDIREPRNFDELVASSILIYQTFIDIYLTINNVWRGIGKHTIRKFKDYKPELANEFSRSFNKIFTHKNQKDFITIIEREMQPWGGPCFDGYKRGGTKRKNQK
ncbi:MAG: nucleotidyltransferase domain-containing protein [Alphaproteobacteria bacterium]